VAIGVTFLYDMFGWAAFAGIAVVPLASPFSYLVTWVTYRKASKEFPSKIQTSKLTHICGPPGCDRELAKARDQRISAVNEFLLSVKVIKVTQFRFSAI
jgi:hypothetical protein